MKMRILFSSIVLSTFLFTLGCKKKCGDCPDNHTLVVDNPKGGECICCPDGTVYEDGFCK